MDLPQQPLDRFSCRPLGVVIVSLALAACGGGGEPGADNHNGALDSRSSSAQANATPAAQAVNSEGRLLASNCFQCHGTGGNGGFEEIRGKSAEELLEFLGKPAGGNIMAAHAQGYTPAQLNKIAAYLQR